ncbi:MAG: acyl-CoA dehydrogenase [Nitrospinota bacterium]|nr:MAG: acyl-CoA dehydrogenase [Nitrospinota bacterium]
MVEFRLTEEQEELRRVAREFAQNEIAPVAAEHDQKSSFPWEVYQKAFEIGLINLTVPTEYGGGGLGCLDCCLIVEELAAGCAGIASSLMVNDLAITPILVAGTPEQKERFLKPFCSKLQMGSFCLSEAGAGSDVAAMTTTAKRDGDDYILNGSKMFITNGGVASLMTVFATRDRSLRHAGISGFIVPADLPGIRRGKKLDKMGQRASDTTEVIFEDVRVPRANLLGKEDEGFKIAMKTLDLSRPMIGALAVGLARAAMEAAINYAKERVTFGVPIAQHQAIQFMLADMDKEIAAARLLTWHAAWLIDQGFRATRESSIAKAFATDMAMRVTTDAVQIFGGYGYIKDFPVEKYMRDAKVLQIYEGTNQIQRLVIARHLFGKEYR